MKKKNRKNEPKERFPMEPSQEDEPRQKLYMKIKNQLDQISDEKIRQLHDFLDKNEDRNIFQDLQNNN